MKKQQKTKQKGKVQKSAKPSARKKPTEKKKAKASGVKAKPAKKNNAAKPAKIAAKKPVPKKTEPKKQNKISKPVVKQEKKTLPPKAVKQERPKTSVSKEKGGKANELVTGDGYQKPAEQPLNDRPINEKKAALYPQGEKIKLRIDSRTIITVKSKEALKMWMQRYPNAVQED